MIGTVVRVSWLSLKRDPVALGLTFVLPLVFFSIFAAVFGSVGEGGARAIEAALVVEDDGDLGARLAELLGDDPRFRSDGLSTREEALAAVRSGRRTVAVVIPDGFSRALEEQPEAGVPLELLADTSNPLAVDVTRGALEGGVVRLGLELLAEDEAPPSAGGLLALDVVDVLGTGAKRPAVAYFAAGIGVLFLLFTVTGRGALLVDERATGVVARVLASKLGLTRLLVGRWLFLVALGCAQVTLMFVWGAVAFGLELFTPRHLAGFAVMTFVTAAAAAALGVLLAAACRTRAQLQGVAAVLVLVMAALGGSMFPRFLMPEALQRVGLLTFNAWALDGYQAVFWYEASVADLAPQLAVLAGLTVAFLAGARAVASRWSLD